MRAKSCPCTGLSRQFQCQPSPRVLGMSAKQDPAIVLRATFDAQDGTRDGCEAMRFSTMRECASDVHTACVVLIRGQSSTCEARAPLVI